MGSESIAVFVLFVLGLAPLLILARRAPSRREAWILVVCGIGVAIAVLGVRQQARVQKMAAAVPAGIPAEVHQDGYVSSQPCRACHPQQYDTWRASFHRTMTRIATPEYVKGDFNHRTVTAKGLTYQLDRRGEEFWVETEDFWNPPPAGARPQRVRRRIALVTGSHHMQVYWFASGEGRKLEQLPLVYLFEAQRWIPRDAAFLKPPVAGVRVETGRWNDTCISCHATRGQPRLYEGGPIDSQVEEFGIACEACHGPAEAHVRDNQSPWRRYAHHRRGGRQETITQPARLDARLSSQVCGQCHFVAAMRGADFARWKIDGSPYRPGGELDLSYPPVQFSRPETVTYLKEHLPDFLPKRFWSDGMVRVAGREHNGLIESPCFARGRGARQLACLSCHTMHQSERDGRRRAEWTDDQLVEGMDGDRACLQCHAEQVREIPAHTHHAAGSAGSRCYNCHMPYTTYGLLKAIRSHQVSSPTAQESLATGRPNACNQCHLDRTLEWTAGHLNRWYGTDRPRLGDEERRVAAGVLWTLKGDAGQRALMAWSMGWEPARAAAGSDWQAAYLAPLLNDPYDAVRYIAQRSLRRLPGFDRLDYDFAGPAERRQAAAQRVMAQWRLDPRSGQGREALLLHPDGRLDLGAFLRLLGRREDRAIELVE
jgi:hypothetical protein